MLVAITPADRWACIDLYGSGAFYNNFLLNYKTILIFVTLRIILFAQRREIHNRGVLAGLTPKKRGRKESRPHPLIAENTRLQKENDRLSRRLRQVEVIVNNGLRK